MIHGIGVDIVQVSRMRDGLERHGQRFAEKILAQEEMQVFELSMKKPHFLAKRFAAKEAVVKAMGTGFRDGVHLPQISIGNDSKGRPYVSFTGQAASVKSELGVGDCHISLADEDDYAVAFATCVKTTS